MNASTLPKVARSLAQKIEALPHSFRTKIHAENDE